MKSKEMIMVILTDDKSDIWKILIIMHIPWSYTLTMSKSFPFLCKNNVLTSFKLKISIFHVLRFFLTLFSALFDK